MQLTELERHVLAYFLLKGADAFNMDPRWWPPVELSSIVEDKVRFAVRWFEVDRQAADRAARVLLDSLIEHKAFSASTSDYGPMYQFQPPAYRACIDGMRAADPILARAAAAGPDYWQQSFERLKGSLNASTAG